MGDYNTSSTRSHNTTGTRFKEFYNSLPAIIKSSSTEIGSVIFIPLFNSLIID
jgi:hypothetical protein